MHTNRLLDEALAVAAKLGYEVRHDHLGGEGTAHCQLGEQRLLMVDVAQPAEDQLEQTLVAIRELSPSREIECSESLKMRLFT